MTQRVVSISPGRELQIYASTDSIPWIVGTVGETPDGRRFRFCLNDGTADIAGEVYQSAAVIANHRNLTPSAAAVGTRTVTVTLGATAATLNQYQYGFLAVRDTQGAGAGRLYRVASNPAADASATLALTLTQEYDLREALTASSRIDLIPNPWSAVVLGATDSGSRFTVGYAMGDVAANGYGWYQTRGLACVANIFAEGSSRIVSQVGSAQYGVVFLNLE